MTDVALMILAYQLAKNPTPFAEERYRSLSDQDKIVVSEYINHQDELPGEIDELLKESSQRKGRIIIEAPTFESHSKEK